jgi:hypothetical protein
MVSLLTLGLLAASFTPGTPEFPGPPLYAPQNPIEANRSVLFAPPLLMPAEQWSTSIAYDYASAIELYGTGTRQVLLDAELARLQLTLTRRIDANWFVLGQVAVQGAYSGFMDTFINWYHSLVGVDYFARDVRPLNKYAYSVTYEQGKTIRYGPVDLGLADSKLGVGRMLGPHAQVLLVFGIPTSTNPGYQAGTLQTGLIATGELGLSSWLLCTGSVGIGFTPRTGTLALYQNWFFASFSGGARFKLTWRNFLFFNIFVQTPPYKNTKLNPMDLTDFSIDFGYIFRIQKGTELWVAITEDPFPDGPALDVTFRLGLRTGF